MDKIIEELRAEVARLDQQRLNLIAEANRQIGAVEGAIAANNALIARLTNQPGPVPANQEA